MYVIFHENIDKVVYLKEHLIFEYFVGHFKFSLTVCSKIYCNEWRMFCKGEAGY